MTAEADDVWPSSSADVRKVPDEIEKDETHVSHTFVCSIHFKSEPD